jgi:phage head maturation protease
MSETAIEYAGGATRGNFAETREAKLARAPAWFRELADSAAGVTRPTPKKGRPVPRNARPAAKPAARRFVGWVAGCCCPGVSVPTYSSRDASHLPEQFTDNAVRGFFEQWRKGGRDIRVTWRHDGPVLARAPLDVCLRVTRPYGLEFVCRLEDSELSRLALEQLEGRGLAVSIGYFSAGARQWHVERDGVGRVRVVDEAKLDHIALIPAADKIAPAYRGARAFGISGNRVGCPPDIRWRSWAYAGAELKKQAGIVEPPPRKRAAS